MKTNLTLLLILLVACKNKQHHKELVDTNSKSIIESRITQLDSLKLFATDTTSIADKKYVLSVMRADSVCYFEVKLQVKDSFKTILKDFNYSTNNSNIQFKDANNDGYNDIIWNKKWQDHAYLFNKKIENFIEVGEYQNTKKLTHNNKQVYYKSKPIEFLINYEKPNVNGVETHSELFVITEDYTKISFATIDNFQTSDSKQMDTCRINNLQYITCFVPPYHGRWGLTNIWNSGKVVDSFYLKSNKFNESFINTYWQKNYSSLLKHGSLFKIRRDKALIYY